MILISRIFLAYSFHSVGPSFITTVSEKALKQIAPD